MLLINVLSYLSVVPVPLCNVIKRTVVDDSNLIQDTLLPLTLVVQEHGVI